MPCNADVSESQDLVIEKYKTIIYHCDIAIMA